MKLGRPCRVAMTAAMMLPVAGCGTGPRLEPLSADTPSAIGSGRYRFQLTLTDAEGKAQPDTDFALSLDKGRLPFVAEEKNVWRGRTDGHGRTPVFALPFRPRASQVLLRGRVGDGPYGQQFWLGDNEKHGAGGTPYRLLMCTDPPQEFIGRTDARGYTVYAASDGSIPVGVYADGAAMSEQGKYHREENLAYCSGEARAATGQAATEEHAQ